MSRIRTDDEQRAEALHTKLSIAADGESFIVVAMAAAAILARAIAMMAGSEETIDVMVDGMIQTVKEYAHTLYKEDKTSPADNKLMN